MIINIIGDCDKRPVTYCVIKILQSLGDVLLVTTSNRLIRLSDTGESGGHYQNVMIGVTSEGVDDFFEEFNYNRNDFNNIVVDNVIEAEADLTIYVEGMTESENEKYVLSLLESYKTVRLYKGKLIDGTTAYKMEQFEALRDMTPMNAKVIKAVAAALSETLKIPAPRLEAIAAKVTNGAAPGKGNKIPAIGGTKKKK